MQDLADYIVICHELECAEIFYLMVIWNSTDRSHTREFRSRRGNFNNVGPHHHFSRTICYLSFDSIIYAYLLILGEKQFDRIGPLFSAVQLNFQ